MLLWRGGDARVDTPRDAAGLEHPRPGLRHPSQFCPKEGGSGLAAVSGGSGAPLPPPSARSSPEHCRPQEEL